jgi:hypothetical protein
MLSPLYCCIPFIFLCGMDFIVQIRTVRQLKCQREYIHMLGRWEEDLSFFKSNLLFAVYNISEARSCSILARKMKE